MTKRGLYSLQHFEGTETIHVVYNPAIAQQVTLFGDTTVNSLESSLWSPGFAYRVVLQARSSGMFARIVKGFIPVCLVVGSIGCGGGSSPQFARPYSIIHHRHQQHLCYGASGTIRRNRHFL
jgi:hypothetical protein